ncbi:hypothetical protein LTR16_000156 [Cryomyces antarcticus]|uniref:Uncharacterized protein n=1 Tax=Cryomyces antarcticus TaxID=329879 RepID=A0ABR0KWS5_9PEZI|nr:hypothetical protein LTR39_000441 [Cryomyces antarcticus]KAK5132029.1 hypothetical protein LTR16_000156 [Cryomyces antarcticus]
MSILVDKTPVDCTSVPQDAVILSDVECDNILRIVKSEQKDSSLCYRGWTKYETTLDTDPMEYIIMCAVKDYQLSSYENFAFFIYASPARDSVHRRYRMPGMDHLCDFFTFQQSVVQRPQSTPVQVTFKRDGTVSKVEVQLESGWRPISELFQRFPNPMNPNFAVHQNSVELLLHRAAHQADWWRDNGLSFRFLDLAAEARNFIYEFTMGPEIEPYKRPKHAILYLNKQVHKEATDVLFARDQFCFVGPYGLGNFLAEIALQGKQKFERLRKVKLTLDRHIPYIIYEKSATTGSFSIRHWDGQPHNGVHLLKNLNLKRLEFHIPHPSDQFGTAWKEVTY